MITPESQPTAEVPGRYVLIFDSPTTAHSSTLGIAALEDKVPNLLSAAGYETTEYFPRLGIAVVDSPPEQLDDFSARVAGEHMPARVVPERIYRILAEADDEPTSYADNDEFTWGLQAVQAANSQYTGAGIKVAVLDTGFDTQHPDFAGRSVTTKSFAAGEDAADGHGHGTHCIGTACGPRAVEGGRGYGVASGAEIFAGKVLGSNGSGTDSMILAGIDWALQNECHVISMSLGADVREVHPPYVTAGRRALEQGTLIIAAAGNNAKRASNDPGFVGAPANSPYIMAVGALDSGLQIAPFSARTLPGRGGVRGGYTALAGLLVGDQILMWLALAGVAALLAEATGYRARELWAELVQQARRLEQFSVDVGAGLTRSPEPAQEKA